MSDIKACQLLLWLYKSVREKSCLHSQMLHSRNFNWFTQAVVVPVSCGQT